MRAYAHAACVAFNRDRTELIPAMLLVEAPPGQMPRETDLTFATTEPYSRGSPTFAHCRQLCICRHTLSRCRAT